MRKTRPAAESTINGRATAPVVAPPPRVAAKPAGPAYLKLPPSRAAWDRDELLADKSWRFAVTAEVEAAFEAHVAACVARDVSWESYVPGGAVPAPIAALAGRVREALESGPGVALVRGLDVARFGQDGARLFYLTLCGEFGDTLESYGKLYDVVDRGVSYTSQRVPVSQTRESTGFHTDSSALGTMPDVVGLLCLRSAMWGGHSQVVSAAKVHERLLATKPELLSRLYEDYVRDIVTPGTEDTRAALIANRIPIYSAGRFWKGLTFRYMRYWIETGQEKAGQPLGPEQVRALDALDGLLADPALAVEFDLHEGDIFLVNNHLIAHGRTEYEDADGSTRRRHLVRLWLSFRAAEHERLAEGRA
jgi:hypothetical protein